MFESKLGSFTSTRNGRHLVCFLPILSERTSSNWSRKMSYSGNAENWRKTYARTLEWEIKTIPVDTWDWPYNSQDMTDMVFNVSYFLSVQTFSKDISSSSRAPWRAVSQSKFLFKDSLSSFKSSPTSPIRPVQWFKWGQIVSHITVIFSSAIWLRGRNKKYNNYQNLWLKGVISPQFS